MSRLRAPVAAWHPTLAEIHSAPELAALAIVHGSIHTAVFAIGAAYPELAQLDLDLDPGHDSSAELRQIAARILTDLELLARSIDAYRVVNAAVPADRHLSDDDFPF